MKVFIFARLDDLWQNGNGTAIYAEALRQGKDVLLGDVKWNNAKIVTEVQKAKPDWVFITGRNTMMYPPLYQIHHVVKKKIFIYDCDESWTKLHNVTWKLLSGWVSVVCSSKKGIIDKYPNLAPIVRWIPQDYDPRMMSITKSCDKEYDVCFLGIGDRHREEIISKLQKQFDVKVAGGIFGTEKLRGHDMANLYAKSKIVIDIRRDILNHSTMHTGPSDRIFKVLGSGTMFLTYDTPGVRDLFVSKYHLDLYSSYEDLVKQICFYLAHDECRKALAKQGQQEVLEKHTLAHRIPTYWEIMEEFMNMENITYPEKFIATEKDLE